MMSRLSTAVAALLLALGAALSSQTTAPTAAGRPLNVVLLVIDDVRWDSLGAAGNRIVRTPRIDQLAKDGVRFAQARVTTSICMVSRATLTGQGTCRVMASGRSAAPSRPMPFANTFPAVLRRGGYWNGYVGKYGVGPPREADFDFPGQQGTHWLAGPAGKQVHVTEKNARDSLDFLKTRPKDRPFLLTVGFFAAARPGQRAGAIPPAGLERKVCRSVKIPRPLRGDPKYRAALPPFLSNEANEGRVRYQKRFDTPESYQAYMTRDHPGSSPKWTRPSDASSTSSRRRARMTTR